MPTYNDPLAPESANPYKRLEGYLMPEPTIQPSKRPITVFLHSTTTLEAIISVNAERYRYTFMTSQEIDTLTYLFRKASALRGLNYAKAHSEKCERLESVG